MAAANEELEATKKLQGFPEDYVQTRNIFKLRKEETLGAAASDGVLHSCWKNVSRFRRVSQLNI